MNPVSARPPNVLGKSQIAEFTTSRMVPHGHIQHVHHIHHIHHTHLGPQSPPKLCLLQ